jgi:hypothetical protein
MAVTTAYLADSLFKQCWHNATESSNSYGPMNGILNNRPHLHVSREVECPFPGDVCHDDGTVFVVGFGAGQSYYNYPVDDPLFSAHDFDKEDEIYYPDYEITALGCVEQYRFCTHPKPELCTVWGPDRGDSTIELLQHLAYIGDFDCFWALLLLYHNSIRTPDVHRYLLARSGVQAMLYSL